MQKIEYLKINPGNIINILSICANKNRTTNRNFQGLNELPKQKILKENSQKEIKAKATRKEARINRNKQRANEQEIATNKINKQTKYIYLDRETLHYVIIIQRRLIKYGNKFNSIDKNEQQGAEKWNKE